MRGGPARKWYLYCTWSIQKGGEICCFSMSKGRKIHCILKVIINARNTKACRVLSRIYCLGENVPKGHELPRGSGDMPPPPEIFWNEYALRCNLVHIETQFCDNVTMVFSFYLSHSVLRRGIRTSCALTSSRLDDFFWYSYLYTVMITIFFGGGSWAFLWGGEACTPQIS